MIDKILLSIKRLPAFPMTIQRVIELLQNDDYSVNDVANVIKYDQAIAANILKISNSAYFGSRQRIRSIQDAVIHLGQKQLIRAVQTAGISRYFNKDAKGYGTKAKELWEHSVAVALMSQILSRQFYHREDAILYTAALIHDIGKLVMGEFVNESSERIFQLVSQRGFSFLEAEEDVIGINHAELGGRIAEYWNFPPDICNAIAYHHRPDLLDQKEENTMPSLVYLADQFCLIMGIDGGMDGLAHRGISDIIKKFGLREIDLEKGLVLLLDELEKAHDLMQIA
ncbi:MAG: HDOD domain-containing protein [Syntrophales bacterium]|nr:HDOD domain-containing protein [Syntrophales bacterium]